MARERCMIHSGGFLERGAAGAEKSAAASAALRGGGHSCARAELSRLPEFHQSRIDFELQNFRRHHGGLIAAISQSGSVASLLQSIAGRHGLSFLASTGNEAVTGAEDLIAYAIEDPATRLIVAFVEGFRNPPDLFELAERAHDAGKPVILLKAGLTQDGGAVSRGHTGVIAGSGAVYRQALRQANFILVDDFDELAQTVELAASWRALPTSFRVGMLGTSGGELGAVTDQCVEHGVALPAFSDGNADGVCKACFIFLRTCGRVIRSMSELASILPAATKTACAARSAPLPPTLPSTWSRCFRAFIAIARTSPIR